MADTASPYTRFTNDNSKVNATDPVEQSPLPKPAAPFTPQEQFLYDHHQDNLAHPVDNADGSQSTVSAITKEFDGKHFVIPTIWNGARRTDEDSTDLAMKAGLDNFPSYGSEKEAEDRYNLLHSVIEKDLPGQSGAAEDARNAMERKAQAARQARQAEQDRQAGIGNYEPGFKPEGPNAKEAMDQLAQWRGRAHIPSDQPLPLIYRKMAEARAAGFEWDEINQSIQDKKDAAKAAGFSTDEIERSIMGMSLDKHDGVKPPQSPPQNVPDQVGSALRTFANDWFSPHNVGSFGMMLPEPGVTHTLGSMAKHFGWNMLDFVKTFPQGFVDGAGATAELFNGKDRSPWEWAKLSWEASQFLGVLAGPIGRAIKGIRKVEPAAGLRGANDNVPPGGGAPPPAASFPKFNTFLDGATAIADKHPLGLNDNTLGSTLSALGEHFTRTGEMPTTVAGKVTTYEEFLARMETAKRQKAGTMGEDMTHDPADELHGVPDSDSGMRAQVASLSDKELDNLHASVEAGEHGTPAETSTLYSQIQWELDQRGRGASGVAAGEMIATDKIDKVLHPGTTEVPKGAGALDALKAQFTSLMGDEGGAITLPSVRTDIRPDTMFTPNPGRFGRMLTEIRAFLEPAYMSRPASEAASAAMSWSALRMEQAAHTLNSFGRYIGEMSTTMRYNLIGAIERGLMHHIENNRAVFEAQYPLGTPMREMADAYLRPGSPLFAFAREVRRHLDLAYDEMLALNIAPNYIDHYMPHIWSDFRGAQNWLRSRPLAGGQAFTRDRVFGDVLEGIAAGYTPATDNPITMVLAGLHSMRSFVKAFSVFNEFRGNGAILDGAQVTRGMIEDGWAEVPRYFGMRGAAGYWGHPDAVRILTAMTDTGFMKFSTYRILREVMNGMNAINLAGPGFHTMFVTLDSMYSDISMAATQISRSYFNPGNPKLVATELVKAVGSVIRAPFAPVLNTVTGTMMKRAAQGKSVPSVPGLIEPGRIMQMTQSYVEAGGRFGLSEDFRTSRDGQLWTALRATFDPQFGHMTIPQEFGQMWRDTSAHWANVGGYRVPIAMVSMSFKIMGRVLDSIADPLMGRYVPAAKAGLFYRMMADAERVAPSMGPLEQRHVGWGYNRTIDNRIGEMVYDNNFYNQWVRTAGHFIFRAVGFNFGTIDTGVRGALDMALLKTERIGTVEQFTANTSALAGVVGGTTLMGAIIMKMAGTWNEETAKNPLNYIYPPTDPNNIEGSRIKLPTYANTAWEMHHDPKSALVNRLNPLWPMLVRGATNRNWDGAEITKPSDDVGTNAKDYAKWMQEQMWPYTMSTMLKPSKEQKTIDPIPRMMGIGPAPWAVRHPGKAEKWEHREQTAAEKKLNRKRAAEAAAGEDE